MRVEKIAADFVFSHNDKFFSSSPHTYVCARGSQCNVLTLQQMIEGEKDKTKKSVALLSGSV